MKNKEIQRPRNMSQLDYLWTTYGSYEVSNKIDTENTIPTSTAIKEYISDIGAGITELDTEKVPDNKIKILGKTPDGEELTSILIDEDTKILGFKRHTITQEDIDSGWGTAIGEEWILLETSIGNFKIPIEDLIIKGQESDTIINQAKDGKIVSSIKINNPIINKSVTLKTTSDGLWADLILNPDTESKVLIIKSDKGVECKFNWLGTNIPVGFKVFNTFDEYQLETTESGVIYLVKDVKSIYFNGIKFSSVGVDPQDYYTKEEVYNREQVDAMITPHTNAYTKEESDALYSKIETTNKLRIDLDYESSRALEAESNINKELDRRVTWDESKSKVVLPSGGQLVGIKYGSDGSNPEDGATIAQLSKFDKMDFGSSKYPLNLNVPAGQRPTVQEAGQSGEEAHQIAYLSDIQTSVDAYTKAESDDKFANKTDVYTKSEVDDLISEPIDAYTKSESDQKYATKSEVEAKQDALISGTNIKTFNGQSILGIGNIEFEQGKVILVVSELPESGDSDKVYLVPNESSRTNDIYDEYLWIAEQSKWEFLGNKHVDVDLTNYYTKEEVDELITPHVNAYTKQESDAKYATIEVVNTKVDKVVGKQLSTEDYTSEEKEKLAGLSNYDDSEVKEDVSNNTQAISTLTQTVNSKVDKIEGKGLSTEDYTSNDKTKLAGIEEGAQVNIITSVSGRTGDVVLSKTDVGLNDVDNTSDLDKPISTATQSALDLKVDKVSGKGLSTNDYTSEEKSKLEGIEAEANKYEHPTTSGNKHIPSGGTSGQILVNTEDGTAAWADTSSKIEEQFQLLNTMWEQLQEEQVNLQSQIDSMAINEDVYAYGVEWDVTVADPTLTRIGNPLLHKQLPIQSSFRGCVAQGPVIKYWLNPNNWAYKENGEASVLDGTDGTVKVHSIKFYGKSGSKENKRWVKISTVKIDDTWVEIPELLIDAYRCTVDTTNSDTPKAVSVVNTSAEFRGGDNRADRDTYLESDVFRTDLGKPRTNTTRANMRTYATNAGSELLCYEYYKWIFYWCWVIEYATFNSQAAYNAELTSEGYHQGGLGDGVTTWDGTSWNNYNGYYPLTPCGYGNDIGNFTGIKDLVIPDTTVSDSITVATKTFKMPRWRGFDNPFGDIWTNLEGIVIKRNVANEDSNVYTTIDPEEFTDEIGSKSVAGIEVAKNGYIKAFDLGRTGEIIPSEVGDSTTTYMCDYHWCNSGSTALRTLLVGGRAHHGAGSGLSYFHSSNGVFYADATVGFRTIIRLN